MLKQAYGDAALGRTATFEWHRRFREGRVAIEDDERSRRPATSVNDEHIDRIRTLVRENRRLTVDQLAELTGISHGSCHTNLHEALNMHRVCQHTVPRNLTAEQMEGRKVTDQISSQGAAVPVCRRGKNCCDECTQGGCKGRPTARVPGIVRSLAEVCG